MTINDVEVRQADNNEVTVGTVSEYDIKITECVRECDIDGETTKVNPYVLNLSKLVILR